MADINEYNVHSGRVLNEASTAINIADSTGATTDAAVINPAAAASIIAALKGVISLLVGGGGGIPVTVADGADTAEGTTTDTPADVVEDATARTVISLLKGSKNYLKSVKTAIEILDNIVSGNEAQVDIVASLPAGTNIIGQFGIDQTTDGTTNKVRAFQPTHDNFNGNSNIQVGDADVANGNPVPVSDAGGAISVDIGGVPPQLDDTDKVAVSMYGKSVAAGDTPLKVNSDGELVVNLETADIEIGAVELKNGTSDDRAVISATGELAVDVKMFAGQAPQLDNTDILAVSLHAKNAADGDTSVLVDASGNVMTDPIDRAARDNGKIDVAGIDAVGGAAGQASMTSSFPVVLSSDHSDVKITMDGEAVKIDQTTPGTTNGVVVNSITAGSNIIGQVSIDQTTDGTTNKVRAFQPTHDSLLCNATLQVADTDVSSTNPVPILQWTTGTQVGSDLTAVWVASALINTYKFINVTAPSPVKKFYLISAVNPSVTSDIVLVPCNRYASFDSETRSVEITGASFTVAKASYTTVEDCEDAWNEQVVAEVTSDVDAVNKKVGTNSVDLILTGAFTTGIVASEVISSANLSSYTHIRLWILSDIATSAGDLKLLLDNTANCASPLETLSIPALTGGVWSHVDLLMSDPTACTAIISVGLQRDTNLGAQTINIDAVEAVRMGTASQILEGMFIGGVDARLLAYNTTAMSALESRTLTVRVLAE